jgi:hypothetical protein
MYLPSAGVKSFGVHPVFWGIDTYFKPWFFDGKIVYWGIPTSDRRDALRRAETMAN